MDDLLRYVEEELGVFGQYAREFRSRFPKQAGELHIAGETWEDPSVARLIQSVALLSARIHKRLDDDYPKFTESLLESLYPHYLRPLPSYSVARLAQAGQEPGEFASIPRATPLRSSPVAGTVCQFRTVYPVLSGPLRVADAAFSIPIGSPRGARLPRGVTAAIALTLELKGGPQALCARGLGRVRLFVDGEPSLRAALIDALFMRARGAWVAAEAGAGAPWLALDAIPFGLAGFGEDEALLPAPARSHPAFRLLSEYFAYPEKFNFIDIDLYEAARRLPPGCERFTLHVGLAGMAADGTAARVLAPLAARHLLPGCTPVVNLFRKAGDPIQLWHTQAEYRLAADGAHAAAYEIHSIDKVSVVRETRGQASVTEFGPLYAVRQGGAGAPGHYWVARRDEALARSSPGHEIRLSLVDPDFTPNEASGATLSTELTCSNRDLPTQLQLQAQVGPGRPATDLLADCPGGPVSFGLLRKPTPSWRFGSGDGAHWRLIAHLALCHAGLTTADLPDLRKMLSLYDLPRSPGARRQIAGIVGLEHGSTRAWIKTRPVSALMPGVAIRMTLDEEAFAGSSVLVFAQVMDRYFALNSQLNCFTRLAIVSQQTGEELFACAPRTAEHVRP